ncbi:DUF1700 domain-containing protein [Thomasclavelia sp.]|uniref:DUF1700 domain-containing protein n=1 Tax=Thomasclavelia sp. TaxID=3025757 RepID=UPI0025FAA2BE|nr:DUF1700 domain-containing protein [Thomasclavelia sp.]
MNRKEFMDRLAYLLQDIEDVECQAALEYYEAYFDEAGYENEEQIIKELGSPERVAAIIKAGLENQFDQDIEYSEKSMDNASYKQTQEIVEATIVEETEESDEKKGSRFRGNADRNRILLIFIFIGAGILLFGGSGGLFVLFFTILAILFAFGIGIMIGAIGCAIGAITCFVKGIMLIGNFLGAGCIVLATSFALIALTLLFFLLGVMALRLIPRICKACINLLKKLIEMISGLVNNGGNQQCAK